jgi:hypothetical protein
MSVDQFLLSADTTDLNYPEIRPTLDLNFARVKALDPRITFTRSSGGSYVGADGLIKYAGVNEARFDHDPETGESLGLLVEEARTNLLLRSEEFDAEGWGTGTAVTITPNDKNAPDGTLTADKIVQTGSSSFVFQTHNLTSPIASRSFVLSLYVYATSSFEITLRIRGTGTTQEGQNFIRTTVSNQWVRFNAVKSFTGAADGNNVLVSLYPDLIGQANNNTVWFWGAQLEQGAFPTSYIPTQASTRTRAADIASITGKNFSDFFNFNEGTSFVSFKFGPTTLDSRTFLRFLSGTTGTIWQRSNAAGTLHALTFSPDLGPNINLGIPNTEQFTSPYLDGNSIFSYKFGDIAYSTSGQVQYTNNYTFLPLNNLQRPTDRLFIGRSIGALNHLNGWIKRFTYFPKRLPNAQLQALTR